MQAEKEAQLEQLQIERDPHHASIREGRENASAFPTLDPPRRHNTTTNSVAYTDYFRAMGFGCPISQTWTPHRQDNLSVACTKKGQEQTDSLGTRVEEHRSARGCDRERGQ
jgi:hypothetical protein